MSGEKLKTANMIKDTSFGEISKRELFIVRVYIENRLEFLEQLIRKAKRIMENWGEPETLEELEDFMWDICIFFDECITCPAEFVCKKKGDRQ